MSVHIGRRTYGHPEISMFGVDADVTIGSFCSIAGKVDILAGGEHHIDYVSTFPFGGDEPSAKPAYVHIGNDVWIGHRVTIMGGVTIDDGAVIGAGALVRTDIPAYSVAVGVPARVKGFRFNGAIVMKLLKIRWWDWPDDKIQRYVGLLHSGNIEEFLRRAEAEQ